MSRSGPHFRPSTSECVEDKVRSVEDWVLRHEQWSSDAYDRQHQDDAMRDRSIAALEAGQETARAERVDIYTKIGQLRIRLSVLLAGASLLGGVVAAIATALLTKALGG